MPHKLAVRMEDKAIPPRVEHDAPARPSLAFTLLDNETQLYVDRGRGANSAKSRNPLIGPR